MSNNALSRIFERHYPDASSALARFRDLVAKAKFDFDIESAVCEHEFPPQAGNPRGLPSVIFYYLSGTGFGSASKPPSSPGDQAHLRSSDGIGLNMGCPIRLARALDVVFSLKPEDRIEPLSLLRSRPNHLASVEELLWLTLWKDIKEITRGGELVPPTGQHQAKNVDWFFLSCGIPIFLEAKFRPTDWMRFSDGDARQTPESLFDDIGGKFPREASTFRKCVAAITGYAEPDQAFFALTEKKLIANPGLDAILYRTLLGPVYVCGLKPEVVGLLGPAVMFYEPQDYPGAYPILFNRQFKEQRKQKKPGKPVREQGKVYYSIVPTNRPGPVFAPSLPYRSKLTMRTGKGRPVFENVPPFLTTEQSQEPGSNT